MLFFVIIKSISLSLRQHKTHFITYRIKRAYVAFLLMFIFREFIFFVGSILTNIAGLQTFFAFVKALPCRYLLQTPSFFSSPKIGANSLQTAFPCNCSTCSTKWHTGANRAQKKANLLARLFFQYFYYFCKYEILLLFILYLLLTACNLLSKRS